MRLLTAFAASILLSMFGCASKDPAPASKWTDVLARTTVYYKTGPQQGQPPDGMLNGGTKLRVIHDGGAYIEVETASGVTGWISRQYVQSISSQRGRDY
jgi:hypothetical protein